MNIFAKPQALDILLVEDNPGDARLTAEALKDRHAGHRLHHVIDGIEALAYCRRLGIYGDMPRPDLVLLDLNLPRKDGREVLAELKQDPDLRTIPVVVLTTSQAEQDIQQIYQLHANCFVSKPVDLDQFLRVIRAIETFWCDVVKLPPT